MSKAFPTVGVIGAGQLARMSIAPATALGVNLLLLAADSNDSAAQITQHVVGDYTDLVTVREFAAQCDVITFEHESHHPRSEPRYLKSIRLPPSA